MSCGDGVLVLGLEGELTVEEGTELSEKIIDVVRVDASETELVEDGQEVSDGTNRQERIGVGS